MKNILLVIIITIPALLAAQSKKSGELGLLGGGAFYMGELNRTPFIGTTPAGGVFYKHTFDTRYAVKGTGVGGLLKGEGQRIDGRNTSFNSFYVDVAATGEYNFMPYLPAHKKFDYTPYLLAGIGIMYYPNGPNADNNKYILNLPLGAGFKYNINEDFTCGIEYTIKKTFSDYYDFTYSEAITPTTKQQGYAGDKDWVSIFGIYIAYKIKYRVKCPAFD